MNKLFGTDGIRGEVGKYPLTQEAVFTIGRALGLWLKEQSPRRGQYLQQKKLLKILLGKDTRDSCLELELALLNGVRHEGLFEVLRVGVCPTPTVAYLTRILHCNLGVAISASHNPGSDNGIKFFDADGYKLFSFAERHIEGIFLSLFSGKKSFSLKFKDLKEETNYLSLYTDFAKNSFSNLDLSGLRVVIDCAFGAFSQIAPQVFRELGADVLAINNKPDGKNINVNCGALYPQMLAKNTLGYKAKIGIAFDGDGDRIIVADEKGNILDGDHILAILGQYFWEKKKLSRNSIICTQMSNLGLELYLRRLGIRMIRTRVGDKYVLQEMLKHKINLGGEQSGHIIILERTTTGDGLIVALELIKVMLELNKDLSALSVKLENYPQVLLNVRVKEKIPMDEISRLKETIKCGQRELGQAGRLLVRYSGTEDLARIMVEGKEPAKVRRIANSIAKVIQDAASEDIDGARCKY